MAQSVLKANNIPAFVIRDNAGGMLPVLQVVYPVRLAVRPGDADLARELLDSGSDDLEFESATDSDPIE